MMVYLIPLPFIFWGIYKYDYLGGHDSSYMYKFLMLYFIIISGISYKVGSDVPEYMLEYNIINWQDIQNVGFLSNRQFLWLLLENVCKELVPSFSFFKLIIAILFYLLTFSFFKVFTRYKYAALLLFYFIMSFDINFNILRQSLAIAIFLKSLQLLNRNQVAKAVILIFISVLFHNSAVFLLIIPFLNIVNIRKHIVFLLFSLLFFFFLPSEIYLTIFDLVLRSIFDTGDDILLMAEQYFNSRYGVSQGFSIVLFIQTLVNTSVLLFLLRKSELPSLILWGLYLYILINLIANQIPIIYRLSLYFTPVYIVSITEFIRILTTLKIIVSQRRLAVFLLIVLFLVIPIRNLFLVNPTYEKPQYVQYYPYYSVFTKKVDTTREILF